ncbi:DEAD/DEAH box helicase family protein [Aeromonas veronii]|uniref:DEAD/DEAH box helicase family protein n=1 Tax=Aeromonas veronii TaxID=654 RepID=UPI003D223138
MVICLDPDLRQASPFTAFAPDHFDYIVVDEFHHAAADTSRRLLEHFQPRFLLGLTASPERTDHADILSLCDNNQVFACHFAEAIEQHF